MPVAGELISPLVSGIADAPSGKAYVYVFGTNYTEPAEVFDIDGNAVANPIQLDASGSTGTDDRYVKERVQVQVETSAGVVKRRFAVQGYAAAHTTQSSSFDGTDPVTGSQTAGGVLGEQAAQDLIYQSFGARNWKVLVTGSTAEQYLKDALNSLRATNFPLYNVKDAAYGAVGDGTTDDGPAIQAAITAASVSGGVVFFPAGSYRTVQALSCTSAKVSFLGAGSEASKLVNATAGNVLLTANAGSSNIANSFIKGLSLDHSSTGTTWALQVIATIGMHIEDVRVLNHRKGINAQSRVLLENCFVTTASGGTDEPLSFTSSATGSVVRGGQYKATGVTANASVINVDVTNVLIDGALITTPGGASVVYGVDVSAARCRVVNCTFDTTAAGGLDVPMNITADVAFSEDANAFPGTFENDSSQVAQAAKTYLSIRRGSREGLHAVGSAGASYTVNVDKKFHFAQANANFTWNINATNGGFWTHGCSIVLAVKNTTGGAITESWGTSNQLVDAPGNLAAGATRTRTLVYESTLDKWVQIGDSEDVS